MAEIKSAIQLAMEKTRDLVMDDKEKKSLAVKELAGSVKVIFRRYREGLSDEDEATAQLDGLECDNALRRKIVLDLLDDEFESADDMPAMERLFSFIGFVIDETSHKELKLLEKAYLEEREKMKTAIRFHVTEELASSGISGSSVEVNVEAWPKWGEASLDVHAAFRRQIGKWKERIS